VEVTRVAGHDEENHGVGSVRVVVVNESTYQVDYTIILRQSPGGRGGGGEIIDCGFGLVHVHVHPYNIKNHPQRMFYLHVYSTQ
jgi:hypothetical protein